MARQRRQQKRQQQQQQQQQENQQRHRLERLPVELQLAILEHVSSYEDLISLITSSRSFHAIYVNYKKTILAHVAQATLGESFADACMLQHWQANLNSYTEDEDERAKCSMLGDWLSNLDNHRGTESEDDGSETNHKIDPEPWPRGPYRHIQLKFIHDYTQHTMADTGDQINDMKRLLTAEDFLQILSFHARVIRPLSSIFAQGLAVRAGFVIPGYGQWGHFPEDRCVTSTEKQRIMKTLYRFQICCRLYGPKVAPEGQVVIDLGQEYSQAMASDFFGRFDALENEGFDAIYGEMARKLHKYFAVIEDNMEWRKFLRRRVLAAGHNRWWVNYYGPITLQMADWHGLTAGAISVGLELYMQVRSATTKDDIAAALVKSNPPQLDNFVQDALWGLREFWHFREVWPESWSDEFWE